MALRPSSLLGASLAAVLLLSGVACGTKRFADPVGDVKGGPGPDIASVKVSNTDTMVMFAVRFAKAPPLRVSQSEKWVDMLLIGVDVPPLGPLPAVPGGDWRGADFALGTHGPSKTGLLVRLGLSPAKTRVPVRFEIATRGSTLTLVVPRRALGDPAWFTFQVAAAREPATEVQSAGVDFAPASGTYRYRLTG